MPDTDRVVAEPAARFFNQSCLHAKIEQLPSFGNAFAVHDVEFYLLERRRYFVFHHLHAGRIADDILAVLDLSGTTDVETDRCVKLERVAAAGGFGRTIHNADFHADLVDKDHHTVRPADRTGNLAQSLRHQTCLKTNMRIAHFTFDFGAWHKRSHRVDDQHINRVRPHQCIANFKRLFASVGLRHDQFVDVNTKLFRITGVKRVFGVDKCRVATFFLHLCNHMQCECRLARTFRPKNFDHAAFGQSPDAKRDIKPERTGRYCLYIHRLTAAQLHRRAFAKGTINLCQCCFERFFAV